MSSLFLRIRGPSGALSITISATSTFGELRQRISDDLKLSQDFDLLTGFPPTVLSQEDEESISGVISNNENVRVQLKELSGVQAQGISKKRKASSSAASKDPPTFSFGAKVHSLKKKDIATTSFLVSSPQSRRGESTTSLPVRVRQRRSRVTAGSEQDICEDLMAALNGGSGSKNKMLRKTFHNALLGRYNESMAISRLGSIYSQRYQIVEKQTSRVLSSGASTQIEVTYPQGAGNRGNHTETVDLLPIHVLKVLVTLPLVNNNSNAGDSSSGADAGESVEQGREVLKPANLSKCSPRIFWSLIHHFGPNIYASIRDIVKDVDPECSWLDERKKELSEKAKVNLAQKEEAERLKKSRSAGKKPKTSAGNDVTNTDGSAGVVVDLIESSGSAGDAHSTATATAAAVLGTVFNVRDSKLPLKWIDHFNQTMEQNIVPSKWVPLLLQLWHMEPNASSSSSGGGYGCDHFVFFAALSTMRRTKEARNQLVDLSIRSAAAAEPTLSGNSSSSSSVPVDYVRELPLPQFISWSTTAREVLLSSFWSEVVCGGACEVLRAALSSLRIRTTKELLLWRSGLGGLLEGLLRHSPSLERLRLLNHSDGRYSVLSETRLSEVCDHCEAFQKELPWSTTVVGEAIGPVPSEEQQEGEEKEQQEGEEKEQQEQEEEEEEQWESDHPLVGKRVRVDYFDEVGGISYWVEGTVVGYMRYCEMVDEETGERLVEPIHEPVDIWRVLLDPSSSVTQNGPCSDSNSNNSKKKTDVYEELEEESEVLAAIQRYETAYASA